MTGFLTTALPKVTGKPMTREMMEMIHPGSGKLGGSVVTPPSVGGKNASVNTPSGPGDRRSSLAAWGGGEEGIALDPLGVQGTSRRGLFRTSLLGR